MNLSLYTGGVKPYLEYGWVCAPNTAGQSIAANTITTLTIDTEIADTGNFGSIASNQITLAAGTYYYEASVPVGRINNGYNVDGSYILSLFNNTSSSYITRREQTTSGGAGGWEYVSFGPLRGQFTISASNAVSLRILTPPSTSIGIPTNFSGSTSGDNQRTTLKLWKLA